MEQKLCVSAISSSDCISGRDELRKYIFCHRSMIFLDKLDDFRYVVGVEKEYTDHFWKDKTEENKGETYGTEEDNSIDF